MQINAEWQICLTYRVEGTDNEQVGRTEITRECLPMVGLGSITVLTQLNFSIKETKREMLH